MFCHIITLNLTKKTFEGCFLILVIAIQIRYEYRNSETSGNKNLLCYKEVYCLLSGVIFSSDYSLVHVHVL